MVSGQYSIQLRHSLSVVAGMFIAARGLIGFGIAFSFTAAPLLIMELAFPTQKVSLVELLNSGRRRSG
jgi:hypothetical protein